MILVTGASGLLGSHVLKQLLTTEKSVRAIKRGKSNTSWTSDINDKTEWVEADILDFVTLDKAFEKVTKVVHCAAIISFDNSSDAAMHKVNIEGTKNILALCEKHDIQKLIYISSVAALGRSAQKEVITESAKWISSELNTAYGTSKYLAELEVWRASEEGLDTIILNPSVIIGPAEWHSPSTNLFRHVKSGNPMYPTGKLNYVDVRDVAKIAVLFLHTESSGERYILNAGIISYKSFFKLVAITMNKKAPNLKVNPSLAIFVASILRVVRFFTGIKSNITREAVLLSQLNILFSAEKVEKKLNFKFIPIEDSIRWTCKQLENK